MTDKKPKREGVIPVARLLQLMERRSVTQTAIAKRAGVGRQTVSYWLHEDETVRTRPGPEGIAAFAVLCGVPAGFVVGTEPEPPRTPGK
jgi:transcriptional regulator with XRE-family HTH domain